jgi:hypothetical protein
MVEAIAKHVTQVPGDLFVLKITAWVLNGFTTAKANGSCLYSFQLTRHTTFISC